MKNSINIIAKNKVRFIRILSQLLITVCAFVFLTPFLGMLATSLKPEKEVMLQPFSFFGTRLAFENYVRAWNFFPFGRFMFNSIFVGVSTTFMAVLTSSLAAYAFSRITFRGRDLLFTMYLGTLMIPQQVTVIPLYIIMRRFGWYDTYQALIFPPAFTAFGTFLMRQFFMTIPREIEESGRIDGCTTFGLYSKLIIPMSTAGLATLCIFSFISSWRAFLWPLVITSTDRFKTLPLGIYMFNGQYGTDWPGLMSAAAIAIIPSFIIFLLFQRYLVEGIALTGMGGK
jgi:multiple sugar transport system permease protein